MEGVKWLEQGIGSNGYRAVPTSKEEMVWWRGVVEGDLIGLQGLLICWSCCWYRLGRDRDKEVILKP